MLDTAPAVGAAPDRRSSGPARPRRRPRPGPYLLIAPTLLVIATLMFWPMVQIAIMSFQKVGNRQLAGEPAEQVGTENFSTILSDDLFWQSLRHTVLFAVVAVSLTLLLGTLVGLLLHRLGRRMSAFVAAGVMVAWATPPITAAIIFYWLFGSTGGVVNWFLDLLPDVLVGGDWIDHNWFATPLRTYTVLTVCVVWQSFPFVAVSVLAGLKSLPGELLEAARVDGASAWRSFWQITFPLLRPIFLVLLVLSIIWDFKVFTQLFIMSGMANRDAFNLSLYAYSEAFGGMNAKLGMGSAIATVLTLLLLAVTAVYVRIMVRQGETS
ncbi:N,N'-diacetylchitobiose transport system permease protein [Thermomonospora echinospora]|uniref:N,N'-diacetylchitobiose transport system permease protein n=1 Tax=Thermomonospora echinospora TaxID=1992 RepID=A0A1H6BL25_9ACTN|nr:sugar ABC transporter permease [Thermomonospora echinospora]SEG61332.1 N,N'-diacetylchitobiose transport system permease protein [Thermomonospora echinospora]